MDCIFCAIAGNAIPATKVYEEDQILAFMDINPANPGHLLVIPKRHYRNIFDIDAETAGKIMQVGTQLASAIKTALNPDGLNLLQSSESAAFQTVFHFHLHLIPRWEDDTLVLPWKPQQGDINQIAEVADKIRQHIQ
ncbi:MAG: HIT family protein [Candidatus Poribacteria bacterium]|nr:HIT family protein [Candidatus Poribacteria bacterium]